MRTDLTQRRRLYHLESRLDSLVELKISQVIAPMADRVRCVLSQEEVRLFLKHQARLMAVEYEQVMDSDDLYEDNRINEIYKKLDEDPEALLLFRQYLYLTEIRESLITRFSFDSAHKDFKRFIFLRKM